MKGRLSMFVTLQKLLLVGRDPARDQQIGCGAEAPRRLGHLATNLLTLGVELRAEVPDPRDFVRISARAATEAALLVSPLEFAPNEAIDHLAALQQARLGHQWRTRPEGWQKRGPEVHLARAFWQLCGLGLEVLTGNWSDGQIEEHAADLANYLLFTASTSGAWDLAFQVGREREGSKSPRASRPCSCQRRSGTAFRLWNSLESATTKETSR